MLYYTVLLSRKIIHEIQVEAYKNENGGEKN